MNELLKTIIEIYKLKESDVKTVTMKKIADIPMLKTYIPELEKKVDGKIASKACFHNAYLMMDFFNKKGLNVAYNEGYVGLNLGGSILPIEHAWNSFEYEGKEYHFDATSDILFDGDIGKGNQDYVQIYSTLDVSDIKAYVRAGGKTKCIDAIHKIHRSR